MCNSEYKDLLRKQEIRKQSRNQEIWEMRREVLAQRVWRGQSVYIAARREVCSSGDQKLDGPLAAPPRRLVQWRLAPLQHNFTSAHLCWLLQHG